MSLPESQVQCINEPLPRTWAAYRDSCLSTFRAGLDGGPELGALQSGMRIVFRLLEEEFPPAEQCKAAPELLVACKALIDNRAWESTDDPAWSQVRAAIALAELEAPQ